MYYCASLTGTRGDYF
nr:immunoglobulin heavy chain junction region [Mus musculus]